MNIDRKTLLCLSCAGLLLTSRVNAQYGSYNDNEEPHMYLGSGAGLDFGGFGLRFEGLPVKYLGIFAGAGYNFKSLGVNAGLAIRPLPDAKVQPVAMVMYGYNGVINIKGGSPFIGFSLADINKTYYGLSTGLGGELKVGEHGNRLYLAVWYPFRSKEFHDNYDMARQSPYIHMNAILPVAFSFGFKWAL